MIAAISARTSTDEGGEPDDSRRSSPAGRRLGGPPVHDSTDFRVPRAIESPRGP